MQSLLIRKKLGVLLGCLISSMSVFSQSTYPGPKAITLILPFAAGSGTDMLARNITSNISKQLPGVSFVIDNKPGANGILAASLAAKAPADGYTLFFTTNSTQSVNPVLYKKLPYDPVKDFAPISLVGETAPALLASANNPVDTVKGVFEQAIKSEAGLNFASANTSSLAATELFKIRSQAKITLVNYKSAPQALTDLTGGTVDYFFGDLASGGALVRGGKLKPLAVLSEKRLPGFAQVPTMAEAGYPGFDIPIWIGVFAPKGTPSAIIDYLNAAIGNAQKQAEVIKSMADGAVSARITSVPEFNQYVATQAAKWVQLAKEINLQQE
jgi:tripartite-type tricarboxylate transporter receptor subunit TctC